MDAVKEILADAIGPRATEFSDALGEAAVREIIDTARELLEHGQSVIVEGFFQSDRYSADFAALTGLADTVLVHLRAADAVLKDRYEKRALEEVRHWIHGDREKLPTLQPELPSYMAERLRLDVPQLIVDTTHSAIDIVATVSQIRHELEPRLSEQPA